MNSSKTQSFETFYIQPVTKIIPVIKMDTKQNRKDKALGELWNCKEELEHNAIKQSVGLLISLMDNYKPVDVLEVMRMLEDLRFEVDNYNFCYNTKLKFDLGDVKRALNREMKIKKSKIDWESYKGGRPSIIREWVGKYQYLKEGYHFEFKDEKEFWNVAKLRLSRTTFWRLRKKLSTSLNQTITK